MYNIDARQGRWAVRRVIWFLSPPGMAKPGSLLRKKPCQRIDRIDRIDRIPETYYSLVYQYSGVGNFSLFSHEHTGRPA